MLQRRAMLTMADQ